MKTRYPKAVMRAAEEANQMIIGMSKPTETIIEDTQEAEETQTDPVETVATEVKQEPVAPVVPKEQTAEYWEHRFKTVQGIAEAEKAANRAKIQELSKTVDELKDKLTETVKQVPKAYDLRNYLSQTEIDTYGEDLISTVLRGVRKMSEEQIEEAVQARVAPIQNKLRETEELASRTREETFWSNLNINVPNWALINGDPAFHSWLAEVDPYTGLPRQSLLADAQSKLDPSRVTAIFKAFEATIIKPSEVPVKKLDKKVIPESSPAGDVSQSNEGGYVTAEEIDRFYRDVTKGAYRTKPTLKKQMEDKINKAIAAGRVR